VTFVSIIAVILWFLLESTRTVPRDFIAQGRKPCKPEKAAAKNPSGLFDRELDS
jgi:hypothetical protein